MQVLIFLLTVYLMVEKTSPGMFDGGAELLSEIEASVKSYISLKTVRLTEKELSPSTLWSAHCTSLLAQERLWLTLTCVMTMMPPLRRR